MCTENYKEIRCSLCGATLKLIPTTQFICQEAKDKGFGTCGQVKSGKPAIFFTNCAGCPRNQTTDSKEKNQDLGETF